MANESSEAHQRHESAQGELAQERSKQKYRPTQEA
jgi:hypothetical protein